MTREPFITVVSGVPRSGTSLMMQMLRASGMPILTDGLRGPDPDNPHGYLEFEPVRLIAADRTWLEDAHGRAVKIVHMFLPYLPIHLRFRVIFMRRNFEETVRSQGIMFERQERSGSMPTAEQLVETYRTQVDAVIAIMRARPNVRLLEIDYAELVNIPRPQVESINAFLGGTADEHSMMRMEQAIDRSMYRNRAP